MLREDVFLSWERQEEETKKNQGLTVQDAISSQL
jgi:hypothetical protein